MNLKIKILKFILFVYENHIQEQWNDYNKLGKIYIFIPWLVRSLSIWLICPIIIPEYLFKQSKQYQQLLMLSNLDIKNTQNLSRVTTRQYKK